MPILLMAYYTTPVSRMSLRSVMYGKAGGFGVSCCFSSRSGHRLHMQVGGLFLLDMSISWNLGK